MKNNKIVFSVIIPIYNCSQYLTRCLDSIISQTYKNFEIILINDGSTDDSGLICDNYQAQETCVYVIHQKNKGVSYARNLGIKKAKGKYLVFLDADDYIDENYFSYAFEMMEKEKLDLLNTGFYSEVENNNKIYYDKIVANKKMYASYEEIKGNLVYLWDTHMLYNVWNKIYLNQIIKKNHLEFANYNFGEDMNFNMQYLNYVQRFYNSDQCFYHYIKERKESLTSKYKDNLFDIRLKEFYLFNEYFSSQGIEKEKYLEFSSRRYLERVLGCIENICGSNNLSKKEKKEKIKNIIFNDVTKNAILYAKPHSKKIKIMLLPIKYKMTSLNYIFGTIINKIRTNSPQVFNKLKNRR